MGASNRNLRAWVLTGTLAQCAWLLLCSDPAVYRLLGAAALAIPIAGASIPWSAARANWLSMALVTGAVGGLGMLVGGLIDLQLSGAVVPACHGSSATGTGGDFLFRFNWANGLMFASCIPACLLLCPGCDGRVRNRLLHALCAVGMYVGMWVGGEILTQLGGGPSIARYASAMHVAMLMGMMLGTALTYGVVRPWLGASPQDTKRLASEIGVP